MPSQRDTAISLIIVYIFAEHRTAIVRSCVEEGNVATESDLNILGT